MSQLNNHLAIHRLQQVQAPISLPIISYCARCNGPFAENEDMACTGPDEFWHMKCFVCAQCFKPFNEKHEYYEFQGRKYCEHDFQVLFAPCCGKCHRFIIGRVIKALNHSWHPNCFNCQLCQKPLADEGFVKNTGRALCHHCNILEKAATVGRHVCQKCKDFIDETPLTFKGDPYHAYHFNCHNCGIELDSDARQVEGDLCCLKCHDKMGIPICGACRRPIEERVVTALGKHFHVDHFVCAKCERPFLGKRHYERKGLAYCEQHYYQLFGYPCFVCSQMIEGDVVTALNKYWCVQHFACAFCQTKLVVNKSKFHDVDSNPCCKKCYKKFPASLRRRLAHQQKLERKLKQEAEQKKLELLKEDAIYSNLTNIAKDELKY